MPRYATLDQLKDYMRIPRDDVMQDDRYGATLDAASSAIRRYCGREFQEASLTEYYDGNGAPWVYVKRPPIITLTSVHDDPDRDYTSSSEVLSADRITYANEGKIFRTSGGFASSQQNIKVIYIGGFTLPGGSALDASSVALPDDVRFVCIEFAAFLATHPTGSTLKREVIGGSSVMDFYDGMIPKPLSMRLDPWVIGW